MTSPLFIQYYRTFSLIPKKISDGLILELNVANTSSYTGANGSVEDGSTFINLGSGVSSDFRFENNAGTMTAYIESQPKYISMKYYDVGYSNTLTQYNYIYGDYIYLPNYTNTPTVSMNAAVGTGYNTASRTVECWARITAPPQSSATTDSPYGAGSVLFGGEGGVSGVLRLFDNGDDTCNLCWTWDGSATFGTDTFYHAAESISLNTWNQIVVVLEPPDAGPTSIQYKCAYYINGVSVGNIVSNDNISVNTLQKWFIGRGGRAFEPSPTNGFRYSQFVHCDISIFRQYNRALTANEIKQNYNAERSKFGLRTNTTVISNPPVVTTGYNPPFPRLGGRMPLTTSLTEAQFYEDTAKLAKFHVWLESAWRNHSYIGGAYNMSNIVSYIRSLDSPYPGNSSIMGVYTNPVQQGTDVTKFINKVFGESGVGGNRDWMLRYAGTPVYDTDKTVYTGWNQNAGNPQPAVEAGKSVGGSVDALVYNKFRPNPNLATTPDSSTVAPFTSGMRWHQWYARWYAAPSSERTANLGDWTDSGYGLMEPGSGWDFVYSDEVNLGDSFSNPSVADWDDDGVQDNRTDTDVQTIIKDYHVAYRQAWQTLYDYYGRSDMYFFANFASLSAPAQPWYTATEFVDVYHGGLVERVTSYEKGTGQGNGWGDYTTSVTGGDTGTGFMGRYWRSMRYAKNPKLVLFENDVSTVMNQWTGISPQSTYSEWRWARYYLCACLMDDGYYTVVNGTTGGGGTQISTMGRIPWLDEYHGGDELNQKGWMGYPVSGTPPRAAYSNGVWVREFDNALVVVNPYQNGQQTITLPSAGSGYLWKRLVGSQDSTVNNGNTQSSSLTIAEQDGIILRRVAV